MDSAPTRVTIGDHEIGPGCRPFVIAEMSGNHNGELARAMAIVDAVAESGAQAIKLQTYRADTITIDVDAPAFWLRDEHGLWGGRRLYELYEEAHTPWEWHEPLFERARDRGLVPFSSPFDPSAIELLESLDAPAYKIASAELVDLPLIRLAASTGKPLVISTGMATLGEIDAAVRAAREAGGEQLVLLACTASYPAAPEDADLHTIPALQEAFGVPVGLSDHTYGIGVAVASVALGSAAIEKHVTLRRADGGVDSDFSLEPHELTELCRETDVAHRALGPARFGPRPSEQDTLMARRSLYVVADARAGEEVTRTNVRSIRPAGGLPPDTISTVLGRRFTRDVSRGSPLTWDLI
jgi:pseudaminic acid synthase